jgi:predicted membrane protein
MGFLFSGIFWGSVLILLGISVIIRIVFNVHVPLLRIMFALVLIYLGIRVLVGGAWCRWEGKNGTVMFSDVKTELVGDSSEYNIIFGKGVIGLNDSALAEKGKKIKVNTIFGAGELRVDPSVPAIIKVTAAFGGARMPDGNMISFGEYVYKTKAFSDSAKAIRVDAAVVFGGLEIIER